MIKLRFMPKIYFQMIYIFFIDLLVKKEASFSAHINMKNSLSIANI